MRMVATCHVSQQAHVHDESLPSDHLALRFDGLGWLMALDSAIDPHMQGVRWIHFISGKGVYLLGIAVKDAIHLCGFQEGIAAYLCSSQSRSRVCCEEWVSCMSSTRKSTCSKDCQEAMPQRDLQGVEACHTQILSYYMSLSIR